ncbi:MAG: aminotransferase, partial [Candidatus Diapherotrites archaeon]|nr:aminotransferase [Candidatus Diapherotrites archaeon]
MNKVVPSRRTGKVFHALREVVPIAQAVEKTGKKVLYLNIGDPMVYDYRTPAHLWKAIFDHQKESEGYSNSLGSDGAREAIAAYARRSGVSGVTKEDV